ncbi:MAG: transposase [Rhabdochlamydiaceae bacterium]|nr:transposase [Rhabdochlamydiaceae bacterium]
MTGSKGSSSTSEQIHVLKQVLQKIGPRRIQAFLADGEFIGDDWFRFLKKSKIPFVIRIKKNTLATGIRAYAIPVLEL